MLMYCKVIDAARGTCSVGVGSNSTFYQKLGMTRQEVELGADGRYYLAGYAPAPEREALLEALRNRIDAATDRTILTGFTYQGTGFKLSLENQMNYKTECELRDSLTYPHRIKTLTGYYDLAGAEEYRLFYLAGVSFIRATIEAGWTRKDALEQLTDAELLARWKEEA